MVCPQGAPRREHSHLKAMRRSARQAAYLEPAGAPAGFLRPFYFNGMGQLSLLRCSSAPRGTDLCEHREHVEVVRGALDLPALDLDDLACRHLDRLV
jgi:hypothetical protein